MDVMFRQRQFSSQRRVWIFCEFFFTSHYPEFHNYSSQIALDIVTINKTSTSDVSSLASTQDYQKNIVKDPSGEVYIYLGYNLVIPTEAMTG